MTGSEKLMGILEVEDTPRGLAKRMALLAFLCQTTTIGCVFGPFAVILTAVEARTGANRELTSLALVLLSVSSGLLAPVVGALASRMSLRVIMVVGALCAALGYSLLALSSNIIVFLAAYGLLIGPGMCTQSVLPSVLVSRWFQAHRGRALGIVHMPVLVVMLPVPVAILLRSAGISAVYWLLAILMGLVALLSLLVIDHSAASSANAVETHFNAIVAERWSVRRMAAQPSFWGPVFAMAMLLGSGTSMSIHIVAMARQWGIAEAPAASLLSWSALAGMAGAIVMGWVADKLGGQITIAIACIDGAILWALMLLHPPYALLAPVVGLLGLHVAGALPAFALSASKQFGAASFGTALGIAMMVVSLTPLIVVPISSALYVRSGSYQSLIVMHVGMLVAGTLVALLSAISRPRRPAIA